MNLSKQTLSALEQAQADYRSRLPARADELEQLWKQAVAGNDEASKQLIAQLHRLGGSAGMYELAQLGQLAKATHDCCKTQGATHTDALALKQQLISMMQSLAAD